VKPMIRRLRLLEKAFLMSTKVEREDGLAVTLRPGGSSDCRGRAVVSFRGHGPRGDTPLARASRTFSA
jgi:hypothetical protein